jgi:hypothetical protein
MATRATHALRPWGCGKRVPAFHALADNCAATLGFGATSVAIDTVVSHAPVHDWCDHLVSRRGARDEPLVCTPRAMTTSDRPGGWCYRRGRRADSHMLGHGLAGRNHSEAL